MAQGGTEVTGIFYAILVAAFIVPWFLQFGGRPTPVAKPSIVKLEWEHPENVSWKITIDEVGVTPKVTRTTGNTYQMNLPTLRSGFHEVKIAACNSGVCSEPSSVRFEMDGRGYVTVGR